MADRPTHKQKVAYLSKGGRADRLENAGPTEFLYGVAELNASGWGIVLLDEAKLGLDQLPSRNLWSAINALAYRLTGIPAWALWQTACAKNRLILNQFDTLFVTTNSFGLCLGLLKRLGLIRAKIVFFAMGLLEPATPGRISTIYRHVLKQTLVCALSQADANFLTQRLSQPVLAVPFGVDVNFWKPDATEPEDYVLSIGNDRHRDYATLLAAWKPEYPMLRIVTKQTLPAHGPNVEVLRGDWHQQLLDDARVRTMMQAARFVVLPIHNTIQPSGQSACLQAMACGKAVLITDFPGLWNAELLVDGKTCALGGKPGDVAGMQGAIERLLADPAGCGTIGMSARRMVEAHLNSAQMAATLAAALSQA